MKTLTAHMKHLSMPAAALALILLVVPLQHAHAQLTTTDTNASPQGGIEIYNGSDDTNIWGNSAWASALMSDINANYVNTSPPSQAQASTAGFNANVDTVTTNRVCRDLDTAMGPGANGAATLLVSDDYSSCSNNTMLVYKNGKWVYEGACTAGGWHERGLTCTSYALPSQTLSLDTYNITAGQSTTLRWADTSARDALTAPSAKGNGAPATTCTTAGFDIPQQSVRYCMDWEPNENWGQSGSYCAFYGSYSVPATTSGTVTVAPTVTTTYTYSCTSANGTHTLAATLNVAQAALAASCSASPTSVTTGQSTSWTSVVSGGSSPYSYSWSGTDSLSGTSANISKTYTTTGTKTASLTVTSADNQTKTVNCDNSVSVSSTYTPAPDYIALTPSLASGGSAGQPATFRVSIKNQGDAAGLSTSGVRFQLDYGANGTYDANLDTANTAIPGLAVGASASAVSPASIALAAGSYAVRACADLPGNRVAESNEGNNCGPSYLFTVANNSVTVACDALTVTNANQPDLTAGAVTPIAAVAGNGGIVFSADITDAFTTTGAGFTNLLQRATDSSGTGAVDAETGTMTTLAPGTRTQSFPKYDLPPGTYYLRACADKSSAADATGVIDEGSNEGNNCHLWTQVVVSASCTGNAGAACTSTPNNCNDTNTGVCQSDGTCSAVQPPNRSCGGSGSVSCTRSPSDATFSGATSITFTAVPSNGATAPYTFTDALGTILQSGSSLTFTRTFSSSNSITVSAANTSAPSYACGTSFTIGGDCSGSPTPSITATPNRVPAGAQVALNWGASGVQSSCDITGTDGFSRHVVATPACSIPDATASPTINRQTTYCIVCDSNQATKQCTTVNVTGVIKTF
jgi:hypothetical protein